jgi:hypothetical protein
VRPRRAFDPDELVMVALAMLAVVIAFWLLAAL